MLSAGGRQAHELAETVSDCFNKMCISWVGLRGRSGFMVFLR